MFKYFNFNGRIGRRSWWLRKVALLCLVAMAIVVLGAAPLLGALHRRGAGDDPGFSLAIIIIVTIFCGWFSLAQDAKRLHDLGHSGWWTVLMFVPVVHWLFWAYLGFFKGQESDNRFGSARPAM
jgi:uncharacterized membrane protein YhaH (DUF805 family)